MMRLVPLLALVALACNTEPEGGEIRIDPGLPSTSDDLVLVIAEDAVDPNKKDVVDYQIAWTRDGEAVDGGETIGAAETAKGQVWAVTVVPTDGKKDGAALTAEVTILPPQPSSFLERLLGAVRP